MQVFENGYKCPIDIESPDHIPRKCGSAQTIWNTLAQFLPSNCKQHLQDDHPFELWFKKILLITPNYS